MAKSAACLGACRTAGKMSHFPHTHQSLLICVEDLGYKEDVLIRFLVTRYGNEVHDVDDLDRQQKAFL